MKNKIVLNERYQKPKFYIEKGLKDKILIRNNLFYDLSFCSGVLILGHNSKIFKKTLKFVTFGWLFSPISFTISTRGNADPLVGLLCLGLVNLMKYQELSTKVSIVSVSRSACPHILGKTY